MIPLETARWRLATVWFGGGAVIATILAVQSLFNVYGDKVPQVWGWALPNIVPTLRLSLGLSCFHLFCVTTVILAGPILPSRAPEQEFDLLHSFVISNLWLGPLQGLVAAALGVLFFSKAAKSKEGASPTAAHNLGPGQQSY